ncbi:hypothetical protein ACOSQ2_022430 [Xanthoceras sorbifolium]
MGVSWVVFLLLVISSCGGAEVVTIDVRQAKICFALAVTLILKSGTRHDQKIIIIIIIIIIWIDLVKNTRTLEEYKKGHVDAAKIINIPCMFNTPEGLIFIFCFSFCFCFFCFCLITKWMVMMILVGFDHERSS